jgi:hypothetical protein
MSPPYGWRLSAEIDGLLVGAAHVASITVCAVPLRPDFCPVEMTWRSYVPGTSGVKVGVALLESLNVPLLGPETTDHAYEYVLWNRLGHAAASSSSDVTVAASDRGSIGLASETVSDTLGLFAPHDADEMVKNAGADVFPSESRTTTLTWYDPGTSATNDGVSDDPELRVA